MSRKNIIYSGGHQIEVIEGQAYIENGDLKHAFKTWGGAASNDENDNNSYCGYQVGKNGKQPLIIIKGDSKKSRISDDCQNYINYRIYGGKPMKKPLLYQVDKVAFELDLLEAQEDYFKSLYKRGQIDNEQLFNLITEIELKKQKAECLSEDYKQRRQLEREREQTHKIKERIRKLERKRENSKMQRTTIKNNKECLKSDKNSINEDVIKLIISFIIAIFLVFVMKFD